MNKIALRKNVRVDYWTAELAIISGSDLPENLDFYYFLQHISLF